MTQAKSSAQLNCSNCCIPLQASRIQSHKDRTLRFLGFQPVRCKRCCQRSYVRGFSAIQEKAISPG
jgi:hypothetical protein